MEIFANHKGFFIIKSLRIENYLTLWKNGTFFYSNSTTISPSQSGFTVNPRLPFPESPSSFWSGSEIVWSLMLILVWVMLLRFTGTTSLEYSLML